MKNKLFNSIIISSILCCGIANADVHSKGADGPAAIDFIAENLLSNIDIDSISCDDDPADIAKDILAEPHNSKLLKLLPKANKSKDAKSFLKLIGINDATFKQAAELTVSIICDDGSDDGDDSGDDDLEE